MRPNHILKNLSRIRHIPLRIAQGTRDWCTPPEWARKLRDAYGENVVAYDEVDSGHLRNDTPLKEVLKRNNRAAAGK